MIYHVAAYGDGRVVVSDDVVRLPNKQMRKPEPFHGEAAHHLAAVMKFFESFYPGNEAFLPVTIYERAYGIRQLVVFTKNQWLYNDTYYSKDSCLDVICILNEERYTRRRLRLWYGDPVTGKCWGDYDDGYISRSMGPIYIPISVYNSRAFGGSAILTGCIMKIQLTKGKKTLWQHPLYTPFICPYCHAEHGVREACLERSNPRKE